MSASYATELIRTLTGGVWGDVLAQQPLCEAAGRLGAEACKRELHCAPDGEGRCSASRAWVASMLASRPEDGGAGLGEARCGLLGSLLASGGICAGARNSSSCAVAGNMSGVRCNWDAQSGCDVSRQDLLVALRRDYRDELARVGLRRDRCKAHGSAQACDGECQWQERVATVVQPNGVESTVIVGRCMLRESDALVTLVDREACPVTALLRRHWSCDVVQVANLCEAYLRDDGRRLCFWTGARCEAHPVSLEFDLLLLLGASRPELLTLAREAHDLCADATSEDQCSAACAPSVTKKASRATRSGLPEPAAALIAALLAAKHSRI